MTMSNAAWQERCESLREELRLLQKSHDRWHHLALSNAASCKDYVDKFCRVVGENIELKEELEVSRWR